MMLQSYDAWRTQAPDVYEPTAICEACGQLLWIDEDELPICDRCMAELDGLCDECGGLGCPECFCPTCGGRGCGDCANEDALEER